MFGASNFGGNQLVKQNSSQEETAVAVAHSFDGADVLQASAAEKSQNPFNYGGHDDAKQTMERTEEEAIELIQ